MKGVGRGRRAAREGSAVTCGRSKCRGMESMGRVRSITPPSSVCPSPSSGEGGGRGRDEWGVGRGDVGCDEEGDQTPARPCTRLVQ